MGKFLFKFRTMGAFGGNLGNEKVALIREPLVDQSVWQAEITTFARGDIEGLLDALHTFIRINQDYFFSSGALRPKRECKTLTFEYDANKGLNLDLPPDVVIVASDTPNYTKPWENQWAG